jgi:RHS repeat-associated protein
VYDPQLDSHLFGFTGRETEVDTGLTDGWMYYRARYYNPSTGRFVSQDPIGYAAGDANL